MSEYRFILEPYQPGGRNRFHCPQCHKKREFTRYIDKLGEVNFPDDVGKCNNVGKCGYHKTPKDHFAESGTEAVHSNSPRPLPPPKPKETSYVSFRLLKESRMDYEQNHFASYLFELLGEELAKETILKYQLGTSHEKWQGATVFWQIDSQGRIRTGKVMLYDSQGKRVKKPYPHLHWMHSLHNIPEFQLSQCPFGEHLLGQYPHHPVAVVESEKTAMIASAYFPQFVWIAIGGLSQLSEGRLRTLKGREVHLFPDLNGFEAWQQKAQNLTGMANVMVSSLLEQVSTDKEKAQGMDLADYLVRFKVSEFRQLNQVSEPPKTPEPTRQCKEVDRVGEMSEATAVYDWTTDPKARRVVSLVDEHHQKFIMLKGVLITDGWGNRKPLRDVRNFLSTQIDHFLKVYERSHKNYRIALSRLEEFLGQALPKVQNANQNLLKQ